MSFEFDERWQDAGWEPCIASAERAKVGREERPGRKHPLAPGLVVHERLENDGNLTVTHASSGLGAGILTWPLWTPCPVALRDALAEACKWLDFVALTPATAPYVDTDIRDRAMSAVRVMYGHVCVICKVDHATALATEILELEKEIEQAERQVESCADALADAEEDVAKLRQQLADLRARKNAAT
jgi:hypothetical protein